MLRLQMQRIAGPVRRHHGVEIGDTGDGFAVHRGDDIARQQARSRRAAAHGDHIDENTARLDQGIAQGGAHTLRIGGPYRRGKQKN